MTAKVVFISGSSRGIGAATAKRFAREGFAVVLTYNSSKTEAENVAVECRLLGAPETLIVQLDLTREESIRQAARLTLKQFPRIDILINNAGIYQEGFFSEQTFEDIHRQIATNLEGQIKLTHELLPAVIEALINIASRLGLVGKKRASVYTATKWGLRGFTKSVALERPDLRVLAVLPGLTATAMGNFGGTPPEKVAEVIYQAAVGNYHLKSGRDAQVRNYVLGPAGKAGCLLKSLLKFFLGRA